MADQITPIEVPKLQEFQAGRRELDVSDYLEIARRNLPWLIAPAFAGLVIATLVAFLLPDVYISRAQVKLTPADVPDALIPKLQTSLDERVNQISAEIQSRTMLTEAIKRLNLYEKDRKKEPIEDIIERIRKKRELEVIPIRSSLASSNNNRTVSFMIQYKYTDRYKAQQMVKELTDAVVNKNEERRIRTVQVVNDLVLQDWKNAKERLDKVNMEMTVFQTANAGALPDNGSALMAQMTAISSQMNNLNSSISRIQADKVRIDEQITQLQARKAALRPPTIETQARAVRNMELERVTADLARAEGELEAISRRYTPNHPDVKSRQNVVDQLRARRDEVTKRMVTEVQEPRRQTVMTPEFLKETREIDEQLGNRVAELKTKEIEYQDVVRQQKSMDGQLGGLQGRMGNIPRSSTEMMAIFNQQRLAQEAFNEADKKRRQAENFGQIERNELNERLDILDGASLPQKPDSPTRIPIILGGLAAGMALGMVVVGFREIRDTSLKTLKDVRAYTQLGILGTIPLLEDDLVTRRRRRLGMIGWATAVLFGVAVMAGAVIFYNATQGRGF
jgi:polysaccharide biosynthesis transport protein